MRLFDSCAAGTEEQGTGCVKPGEEGTHSILHGMIIQVRFIGLGMSWNYQKVYSWGHG